MAELIAREVAEKDVTKWLDMKKVSASLRESYRDFIDIMIDAVQDGALKLEDDGKWTHKLIWPIGQGDEGTGKLDTLQYHMRINSKMLRPYLNGVKQGDADGRMDAHIAALTKTAREIIASMDSSTDKRIANAIALFFS